MQSFESLLLIEIILLYNILCVCLEISVVKYTKMCSCHLTMKSTQLKKENYCRCRERNLMYSYTVCNFTL